MSSRRWISAHDLFRSMEREVTEEAARAAMPPYAQFAAASSPNATDAYTTTELRTMMGDH